MDPEKQNEPRLDQPELQADQIEPTESNIDEFIEILDQHRKKCEKEGKYVEAEMAKNRINEIKAQEIQKSRDNLRSKQLSERLEVEEAHMLEFNQFNQLWDKKMQDFQQNAHDLEKGLIQKHAKNMEELRNSLEHQLPPVPKPSPELLNLKKIQESLAKQKDYAEAHKVQQRALELEKQEQGKYNAAREQKIAAKEAQLAQKQNIELQALKKRIASSVDEQRKTRALQLERLLQRYQNIKKELENQQQLERIKKEKQATKIMSSSNAFSRASLNSPNATPRYTSTKKKFSTKGSGSISKQKHETLESGISPPSANP